MARIALPAGDQPDVVKALMLRPKLAVGVAAMNDAVADSALDWRLHELVRMRVAVINGCQTCLTWRTPEAVDAGVTEDLLADVANWRTSARFTAAERSALHYTELFCADSTAIDDELLAELATHFDPGEVVDLTLVIGKYLSQGRFMQVLGLDEACVLPGATAAMR
jgi:AhpD family alkylhydroperoxidase